MTWAGAWGLADLPEQGGRTTLVTGCAAGGSGHHVALELARRGGRVVLTDRSEEAVLDAEHRIRTLHPGADLHRLVVDLADLTSIRTAAEQARELGAIDCLLHNAGVTAPPYHRTVDGFELQLATNHLGPFLLTGLLLPQVAESGDGRVVTVTSFLHRFARQPPLDDPRNQHGRYQRWQEYSRSRLANLLFTFELERRLRSAELPVRALAAHPGYAGTERVDGHPGRSPAAAASILDAATRAVTQSAADGALPLLMAATADLPGGTLCGPGGVGQLRGRPRVVRGARAARDEHAQRALWELSELAVGLRYP